MDNWTLSLDDESGWSLRRQYRLKRSVSYTHELRIPASQLEPAAAAMVMTAFLYMMSMTALSCSQSRSESWIMQRESIYR